MADTAAAATTAKPKVTLHWLDQSRAQRIVWLLRECKDKIDYDIKVYKRGKDFLAPDDLKKNHPLGKSPQITIESANIDKPIVLAESGMMTEYLVEHFANHLEPKKWQAGKEGQVGGETEEWLRYRYYMHFAEGSLMSFLLLGLVIDQIREAPVPFFIKPITRTVASKVDDAFLTRNFLNYFNFLEQQVGSSPGGGKYICGNELTAADMMMSFPLLAAKSRNKIDKAKYPKLIAYIETLEKNEGYQASVKEIEEKTGDKFKVV
ncbi:hypothetical protein PRZ48_002767 [Zasmidium cellare]|uniref:GST C-terminal domain-containing protein n=1 Tax=Zasmidium cellare TaxID=395010 RepID=A0ABR0EU63_ZASCE|nr:hypothetical protein PRZ48_002767 [Zasmidium cellare]